MRYEHYTPGGESWQDQFVEAIIAYWTAPAGSKQLALLTKVNEVLRDHTSAEDLADIHHIIDAANQATAELGGNFALEVRHVTHEGEEN